MSESGSLHPLTHLPLKSVCMNSIRMRPGNLPSQGGQVPAQPGRAGFFFSARAKPAQPGRAGLGLASRVPKKKSFRCRLGGGIVQLLMPVTVAKAKVEAELQRKHVEANATRLYERMVQAAKTSYDRTCARAARSAKNHIARSQRVEDAREARDAEVRAREIRAVQRLNRKRPQVISQDDNGSRAEMLDAIAAAQARWGSRGRSPASS